ncbi:hypothetical protein RJ639_031109 [Escallonia herrerae]|uniref:Las1-like protein n=1 Tax=Escallonia herrerae TaxID=1293975 RepID=A0AA89BE44_9ASTE|nr:hypothetical protein RJ639_031109 [Escallonia herrerae]
MESLLGFEETISDVITEDKCGGYKLVPWISWQDWSFVSVSLFSKSPDMVATALNRISAWRSRGCVPVVVEVTASIIEIQQKDPYFREDLADTGSHSEEMLAMLYCMAIMRLVNGVVEKTRKKTEVSIGEAADAIGIPRMLIDIRHEGSHRDLPSLRLVRLASTKALDWLVSYYWEPQKSAIPSDRTTSIKEEVKSTLRELALCMKVNQAGSSSSVVKGKRVKHFEPVCGPNKFFSLVASKHQSSKSPVFKKHIAKIMKKLLRSYASFSSEIVSVLLELLLEAIDSVDLVELPKSSQVSDDSSNVQTLLDDWKSVVVKLSSKEPELLLTLLKAVLERIENQEAVNYDFGGEYLTSGKRDEVCKSEVEILSNLFEWLVGNLKGLKPVEHKHFAAENEGSSPASILPKATLVEIIHKCLLASSPGNNHLTSSALVLARMTGNNSLVEKLNKLALLQSPNTDVRAESLSPINHENFLSQQDDFIHLAAEKLEFLKHRQMKSKNVKTNSGELETKCRWVVAKSWNPCPIGMLPGSVGYSGHLPILDHNDDHKETEKLSETKEHRELDQPTGKRGADCAIEVLDTSRAKRMRESEQGCETNEEEDLPPEGIKGRLMIGGVWKKVRQEEVTAIASAVRILV